MSLSYPPLLRRGQAYVYAGYLGYGVKNAQVLTNAKQKTCAIVGEGRDVLLHRNQVQYRVNGTTKQMKTPPLLVEGRWYVPVEAVEAILAVRVRYEAGAKQVRFDPAPFVVRLAKQ